VCDVSAAEPRPSRSRDEESEAAVALHAPDGEVGRALAADGYARRFQPEAPALRCAHPGRRGSVERRRNARALTISPPMIGIATRRGVISRSPLRAALPAASVTSVGQVGVRPASSPVVGARRQELSALGWGRASAFQPMRARRAWPMLSA
jgi:hypothetical protein